MIYLDHAATSMGKPESVRRRVLWAMEHCANPGRGGHRPAMDAAEAVFSCRKTAGAFFGAEPEQVAFTSNCTHGLNIAIRTLVHPGDRVVVSGFEHNAVTRPLTALKAQIRVAGRRLFDWDDTLASFEKALSEGAEAAVFTYVSNVFGYILPVEDMGRLCRRYQVPFIIDAAQAAGSLPVDLKALGADFIAMPGHKGLLGPQGTGILLCGAMPEPLIYGGTGSLSAQQRMPDFLPDRVEAGTLNVPGICGLEAGIRYVRGLTPEKINRRETSQVQRAAAGIRALGLPVYTGAHQAGVVSFVTKNCEETAELLGTMGICVRAGLHCAPLAHESAGTLETGTVRVSFDHNADERQTRALLEGLSRLSRQGRI